MRVLRRLARAALPRSLLVRIRSLVRAVRPSTMKVGVGQGLKFDAGPSNPAYSTGDNELAIQEALAQHVRPGGVFYDIGANVGFFTVIGAKLVGASGRVVAFEPVPSNARYVRRNARANGFRNVEVVEQAVADTVGTSELVLAAYSGGAALKSAAPPPDATTTIVVNVVTIDDVVDRGLPPPDVVKIDVEGAEYEVLVGMKQTMEVHRPVIVCEIDDADAGRFEAKRDRCVELIRSCGYEIRQLDDAYSDIEWVVGHFVATPSASARQ